MAFSKTRAEYFKKIENALLEQMERVSSSKEEASKLIDSLGMRHLLITPPKVKRKKVLVRNRISNQTTS